MVFNTRNGQSLLHELVLEVVDGRSRVISGGRPVLITLGIGGVRQEQDGGQIWDVGLSAAKIRMPHGFLQASRKVLEEGVQQDVEVALTLDPPPQHDQEHSFHRELDQECRRCLSS